MEIHLSRFLASRQLKEGNMELWMALEALGHL
jgi:hypothetical protein